MNPASNDDYGIGAVARLTGLSDHTIRVWERRYGAVVAARSANGRRVYSTSDVEKLRLLKLLTDRGVAISQVANETSEALKQRLASMNDLPTRAGLEGMRVAVVGEFLPTLVKDYKGPLEFALVETNLERFEADLVTQRFDALVLELATVTPELLDRIAALRESAGSRHCVVVYTFARSRDIDALANQGFTLLRAPVRLEEVAASLLKLAAVESAGESGVEQPEKASDSGDWPTGGEPEPRQYTREQLATLSRISTEIDCECPQHLAQLVAELTAFEVYSASCASRDEDDRALHEYLHRTTAAARASIEAALARVVAFEGIEV